MEKERRVPLFLGVEIFCDDYFFARDDRSVALEGLFSHVTP